MVLVYAPEVQRAGKLYALFRSLSLTTLVICFGGLWRMKRWAVWVYAACFVLNQIVCLYAGTWDKATLGPLLPLLVAAAYYPRMK
jgi:hypothetical protein